MVLVLCNTLVLYGNTLACAACMHALTASLYLHMQVCHLSSTSGDTGQERTVMTAEKEEEEQGVTMADSLP